MCAALIGNVDWEALFSVYEARESGVQLHILSGDVENFSDTILGADFIVLVTDKTTHKARQDVFNVVRDTDIPIYMRHSCGLNVFPELMGHCGGKTEERG
ncbi:DUF2325 domain-containing protein [Pseudodesulfovibrio sediminis]|uniref:DUF2325 domain-containing protein n=1 Tax=Pseudodesulfovibrio sediminis TaxID=2810563 RepID=A0ABM7P4K3_9BACT|nr:DUF2325 domain-containing protein [Pseudodesulfovibrio sediminis]BCS87771.1 hypothetical protein PSDVSF_10130 [Pseudodesulfovibrio sediminis]